MTRHRGTDTEPYLTESQQRVLDFLKEKDEADISDLAHVVKDTHHVVRGIMRYLKQKGLVESHREERRIIMFSRKKTCFVNIFHLKQKASKTGI